MLRTLLLTVLIVLGAAGLNPAQAQETSALDAAYQKEFAYLVAEKRALEARLAELRSTTAGQIAASEAELERLEGRSIRVGLDVERAEQLVDAIDREVQGMTEASDALDATLVAARTTLERDSFSLGERPDDFPGLVDQLGRAFREGFSRISEGSSVRTGPGSFFLQDGTRVEGTVTELGNVAAYGVSERGAGALVPAGEGHLRLWNQPADGAARSIAQGTVPGTLPVYLFESREKRIEEPAPSGVGAKIEAGGIVGLVILGLGAVALVLVVIRGLTLAAIGRGGEGLVDAVAAAVEKGDVERARQLTKGSTSLARVLSGILPHLSDPREDLENAATEAMLREQPRLERFGTAVTVIAAVAPLLGLLGTVTGMIATFDIITTFGTGDPKMLSGGISEALVTTQLGLVVAIPALLAGNLLGAWATGVGDASERAALKLINLAAGLREAGDTPSASDHRSGGDDDEIRAVPRVAHG